MKLSQRTPLDDLRIKKKWLLQGKRKGQRAVETTFVASHLGLATDSHGESMEMEGFLRQYGQRRWASKSGNNQLIGYILYASVSVPKPFTHELTTGMQRSDVTCHWLSNTKTHFLMQNCLPYLTECRKYLKDHVELVFKLIDQLTLKTFLPWSCLSAS